MLDSLPWGWWKIFNMVAGAALATSGFVVAAIIYIFQMKKYRPVARLSVLVGFLGYGASLTALIFDIGLPHRGWHPFFMWNPHSFLFEVFWCVSCYWGVTALELLPILTERFPWPKITHFLHEVMLPFVVLGITLSTMHHSSLGSLFLASPTRLHPLWHTMWIPPEFFISAMGAGMATIILVMIAVAWLYGRKPNLPVMSGLAAGSAWMLALYLAMKIADLTVHEKWGFVLGADVTWESYVFWAEIALQAILPVLIFAVPAFRRRISMLFLASSCAFLGLVAHRLNTGIIGYYRTSEQIYVPNLSEWILSFGVISAAGLLFFFLVEKFPILAGYGEHGQVAEDGHGPSPEPWTWREAWSLLTGPGARRVAVIAAVVTPITWFALRDQATGAFRPIEQPVEPAVIGNDEMRTVLRIDADRDGDFVTFPHKQHQDKFQEKYGLATREETCVKCHHLALPNDNNTVCRACHADMELDTPMFRMENHADRFASEKQFETFLAFDLADRRDNFQACMLCHRQTMRGLVDYEAKGFSHMATGFEHAMHGACMTCHRLEETDPADAYSRGNCLGCHRPEDNPAKSGEVIATGP
jgi:Ni/Fe-hydrogenase subunit HybB-like protein